MSIVLGVLASLLIGVSDTSGRASSRRADSISHVTMQMAVGIVVATPIALVMGSTLLWVDAVKGMISGVLVAAGLAMVYRAMADSSSAIASPAAAVLAAVFPLAWDLITGAELSALAGVGAVVALVSLGLTTYSPADDIPVRRGLGMALAGGVLFGLSIVFGADTNPDAGAWPAAFQRGAGFVAMFALARGRNVPPILPVGVRKWGIIGGIAGAAGMVAWIIGAQRGDLGLVSVIASTYPAVVVALATRFDDDTIAPWQILGILGAIVGTGLIAFG